MVSAAWRRVPASPSRAVGMGMRGGSYSRRRQLLSRHTAVGFGVPASPNHAGRFRLDVFRER